MNEYPLEWSPKDLSDHLAECLIVDVREMSEFQGPLSHIPGAVLKTLGSDLEKFLENCEEKSRPLIFVCRSGVRSLKATTMARSLGFNNAINLRGGMIAWNEMGFPVFSEG